MFNFTRDSQYCIISEATNKKIFEDAIRHSAKARTAIRKAFFFIGKLNVRTARQEIMDGSKKTGRTYYFRVNGRIYRHQASAPYQYPASRGKIPGKQYGRLKDSLDFKVSGSRLVEFGSTVKHGKWLEEGTDRMEPRPFLKMTVAKNAMQIRNAFYTALYRELYKQGSGKK